VRLTSAAAITNLSGLDAASPESVIAGDISRRTSQAAGSCGKIIYPWNAVTSIVKAGERFEVWFDAAPGQTVRTVELHGPYHTVSIPSIAAATGSWQYDPVSHNTYN